MLYYRIPLMSYPIFLAMVANMISLTKAQEVVPVFTPVFGYGNIANANPDIPTGVPMSEAAFNAIWKTSPNEILYRHCEDCSASHQNIYMRRTGDTEKNLPFDMLTMVLDNWFEAPANTLKTNFDLYDTYKDALAQTNKWAFCSYNDPGIGFPRDCGKNGIIQFNWNSIDRTTGAPVDSRGRSNFYYAVETTLTSAPSTFPSSSPSKSGKKSKDTKAGKKSKDTKAGNKKSKDTKAGNKKSKDTKALNGSNKLKKGKKTKKGKKISWEN